MSYIVQSKVATNLLGNTTYNFCKSDTYSLWESPYLFYSNSYSHNPIKINVNVRIPVIIVVRTNCERC